MKHCIKGIFPKTWDQINVSSIYEKDDPSHVSDHRPITLLSTIGKVTEK